MMKKVSLLINKYQKVLIAIIGSLLCIMCILLVFTDNKIKIIKEDTDFIVFEYDSTWKIKENKNNMIILSHKSGSRIEINVTKLKNDFAYSSVDEFVDELIFSMSKQNKDYKLINKKEDLITKNSYNGYKFLYDNDELQTMVVVYKVGDKLVSIVYEASNDYFDILLDSVQNIIYNIELKEEKVTLNSNVKLEMSNISYNSDDNFDKKLYNTKKDKIADNHYLVEFDLPDIFQKYVQIDSSIGHYRYKEDINKKIEITVTTLNHNIYESFDTSMNSVYNRYSIYHDGKHSEYTDFKEDLSKLDDDEFIYKNSYNYKSSSTTNMIENVIMLYSLGTNCTLEIRIESTGISITNKLINNIKANSITNYADYIVTQKEDNYLIGKLKYFVDTNYQQVKEIKLKIPSTYEEVTSETYNNIYSSRHYAKNYDEEYDLYDYNVSYEIQKTVGEISKSQQNIIKNINDIYIKDTYGKMNKLKYSKKISINGKEFDMYTGGYTNRSGVMLMPKRKKYYQNKTVLFYNIDNDSYLEIIIDGNGKPITNDILKELTNFTINEERI